MSTNSNFRFLIGILRTFHISLPVSWAKNPSPFSAYWNYICPSITDLKGLYDLSTHQFSQAYSLSSKLPSFFVYLHYFICFAHSKLLTRTFPMQCKPLKGRDAGNLWLAQAQQHFTQFVLNCGTRLSMRWY